MYIQIYKEYNIYIPCISPYKHLFVALRIVNCDPLLVNMQSTKGFPSNKYAVVLPMSYCLLKVYLC